MGVYIWIKSAIDCNLDFITKNNYCFNRHKGWAENFCQWCIISQKNILY